MGSNPNTFDFLEVWEKQYEISHYVAPVYKAIAEESQKGNLYQGKTFHRTTTGDFIVNDMGADGSYSTQPWVEGDETLQINYAKEVSVQMKKQDLYMTHLPTAVKRAEKLMNRLFNKVDGTVFSKAYQGAGTIIDTSTLTQQTADAGKAITVSQANIPNIFSAADTALIAANIDYEPTGKWTGQYKIDKTMQVPVFVMSSQVYQYLLMYLGGKTTALGDRVSQSGHVGQFMGFNCFVSNALPWSGQILLPVAPTTDDTVTFLTGVTKNVNGTTSSQAITFKFVTSATNPGEITLSATASTNATRLAAAINAPYTSSANYVPFVQSSLTVMQQLFFTNVTATVDGTVNTSVDFIVEGMGNIPVTQSFVSASNIWNSTTLATHCIAGVSRSISIIMPRMAEFDENFVSGKVARDYIAWTYYGIKVFADQAPGLIDVQIATGGFTTMPNLTTN